ERERSRRKPGQHQESTGNSSGEMDGPGARARSRALAGTAQAHVGRAPGSSGRRRQDFLHGGHSLDWCNAERFAPRARPPKFPTLRIRVGLKKLARVLPSKKISTRTP